MSSAGAGNLIFLHLLNRALERHLVDITRKTKLLSHLFSLTLLTITQYKEKYGVDETPRILVSMLHHRQIS